MIQFDILRFVHVDTQPLILPLDFGQVIVPVKAQSEMVMLTVDHWLKLRQEPNMPPASAPVAVMLPWFMMPLRVREPFFSG